jgi:hypothetical protein
MGMSLLWEPLEPRGQSVLGDGVGSEVLKVLQQTFDGGTSVPSTRVDLSEDHVFALRAMAQASGHSKYSALADLIEAHGPIQVWGEH